MTYVVSDIHGYYNKFEELLRKINFKEDDTLYILGDIIDRGPENLKMIKCVMDMPNVILLKGNHEDMLVEYYETGDEYNRALWYHNGGVVTDIELMQLTIQEREEIVKYLKKLPIEKKIEVNNKKFWLVHGNVSGYLPLKEFYEEYKNEVLWTRVDKFDRAPIGYTVIFGHTPVYHYLGKTKPLVFWRNNDMIGIDCGMAAYEKYSTIVRLGCLCLETNEEFYV